MTYMRHILLLQMTYMRHIFLYMRHIFLYMRHIFLLQMGSDRPWLQRLTVAGCGNLANCARWASLDKIEPSPEPGGIEWSYIMRKGRKVNVGTVRSGAHEQAGLDNEHTICVLILSPPPLCPTPLLLPGSSLEEAEPTRSSLCNKNPANCQGQGAYSLVLPLAPSLSVSPSLPLPRFGSLFPLRSLSFALMILSWLQFFLLASFNLYPHFRTHSALFDLRILCKFRHLRRMWRIFWARHLPRPLLLFSNMVAHHLHRLFLVPTLPRPGPGTCMCVHFFFSVVCETVAPPSLSPSTFLHKIVWSTTEDCKCTPLECTVAFTHWHAPPPVRCSHLLSGARGDGAL